MTGHDRTAEFFATTNSKREKPQWIQQQRLAQNGLKENNRPNKLAVDRQYREFMQKSQSLARQIGHSFGKLERLTELARRRTVFDDGELNRLITDIKADISNCKLQLESLQSSQTTKPRHSENIVNTMQQRLANITSSFKSTLEVRSKSVQQQSARHEMFAGPSSSNHHHPNQLVPANELYSPNRPVLIDMGLDGSQPNQPQQYLQPQQQQQLILNDQMDLSERADKMHLIESTIVELGTVFNQLAHMVQAQGETITRIDMNISETAGNVESAHDALLSYFASINSNRWLILKVFGVLFFFFVIFVMFAT